MAKYEVPIVYRGLTNYVVEAANESQARDVAEAKFKSGDCVDLFGNEWEEIERFGDIQKMESKDEEEPGQTASS